MYFMCGKTFIEQYVFEDPKKVLRTQFCIVSNSIKKGDRYAKQAIVVSELHPSMSSLVDTDDYKRDEEYRDSYFDRCRSCKPLLATLIKYVIEEDATVVFLCAEKEKKYRYLNMIQEFVMDEFGFPIYDYKKYKEGKVQPQKFDAEETLKICNKILKKAKIDGEESLLRDKDRHSKLKEMSKKELKALCKRYNLYYDGMDKSDMIDSLEYLY